MKKPHMNLKRTLAVLIALLCVVFSLIGCKIEMPSDEAEPSASPAVTQEAKETHNYAPAADDNQTSNGNVEEESNQSQMPSETSDGDKQSQAVSQIRKTNLLLRRLLRQRQRLLLNQRRKRPMRPPKRRSRKKQKPLTTVRRRR